MRAQRVCIEQNCTLLSAATAALKLVAASPQSPPCGSRTWRLPPDETVNSTQELELLARVIASLPDKCREVLTLRKIHGLPHKQIAARLGIAEHTVEKHISYGTRLCAARLLEMTGSIQRH